MSFIFHLLSEEIGFFPIAACNLIQLLSISLLNLDNSILELINSFCVLMSSEAVKLPVLYFIFDNKNQQLAYLILEVTNTPWGEKHNYVLLASSLPKSRAHHFQFKKELQIDGIHID